MLSGILHIGGTDRKRHERKADPEMPTVHFPQEEQFAGLPSGMSNLLGELVGDCEEKTGKRRGRLSVLA